MFPGTLWLKISSSELWRRTLFSANWIQTEYKFRLKTLSQFIDYFNCYKRLIPFAPISLPNIRMVSSVKLFILDTVWKRSWHFGYFKAKLIIWGRFFTMEMNLNFWTKLLTLKKRRVSYWNTDKWWEFSHW